MAKGDIVLEAEGPGSWRFHFLSDTGELFGRVTVTIEGPPDTRPRAEQEAAARETIAALSDEFAEACRRG